MTWVAHDLRDEIVDFVQRWAEPAELACARLLGWIGLGARKFRDWRARYGKVNEHNHLVPRDHWLEEWEKEKIIAFHHEYPLEGYRRLAFMMLDRDPAPAGWRSVPPASIGCSRRRVCWPTGGKSPRARGGVLSSRWRLTSIGTSIFPT